MAPEELRASGMYINGGRRRGWKKRLAELLATPETTIAAWASRSPGNTRPIPGAVAVAVRLMADIVRQAAAEGASPHEAARMLAARIAALGRAPAGGPPQLTVPAGAQPARPAAETSLLPPPADSILVEPPQPGPRG